MGDALYYLAYTLAYMLLMPFTYIIAEVYDNAGRSFWPSDIIHGVTHKLQYTKASKTPYADWADRAKAAHYNAVENMAVFGPLLVAGTLLGVPNLDFPAQMYFYARLLHFPAQISAIPGLRTVCFFFGWLAAAMVAIRTIMH
mmetsp:Transcript_49629/g.107497  ORF Transcript_49629/g.107497 Transcript_49629/m.107497 type:complete len:142 (-) Transcript_49629:497-922(-)